MLFRALPILLLAACAPADVTSSIGAKSYLYGIDGIGLSVQVADAMEAHLLNGLEARGFDRKKAARALSFANIEWRETVWRCTGNQNAWCAGEQAGDILQVAKSVDCPWMSAYRHEELHLIQEAFGFQPDYNHERPEWDVVHSITDCMGPLQAK